MLRSSTLEALVAIVLVDKDIILQDDVSKRVTRYTGENVLRCCSCRCGGGWWTKP